MVDKVDSVIEQARGYEVNIYSVMQSDGNNFCEDVVLDSFNKASRD